MDGVAPVDAQNAPTSRLENPHRTRVSHTAHAHHFFGRKKENKDKKISEDELKDAEEKVQKLTDAHIQLVDEVLKHKEKEIMEV